MRSQGGKLIYIECSHLPFLGLALATHPLIPPQNSSHINIWPPYQSRKKQTPQITQGLVEPETRCSSRDLRLTTPPGGIEKGNPACGLACEQKKLQVIYMIGRHLYPQFIVQDGYSQAKRPTIAYMPSWRTPEASDIVLHRHDISSLVIYNSMTTLNIVPLGEFPPLHVIILVKYDSVHFALDFR